MYDLDELAMGPSERTFDYPAGAWRLTKRATGYHHTLVNGEVTFNHGECTGATPGHLLRHGTST